MSVSVHCEAKFWWVLGYIQGPFNCQRLFSSVWHGLSRHLLASWKVDICAYSYLFGCHLSLALPSVRFQDVFLMVFLMRRFAWNNHLILLLRRVREGIRLKKSLMNWSSHWELDLDDSPLLYLVFLILRVSPYVVKTTSKKEVIPYNVCGWYHYHWWWCTWNCISKVLVAKAFSNKKTWIFSHWNS